MSFNKTRFGLFFTMPLDDQDWKNLEASKVRMVMMPFDEHFSDDNTLKRFNRIVPGGGSSGSLSVVLRIYPEQLANLNVGEAQGRMLHVQSLCNLEAIIVGNEPDGPFNFQFGSPSWGQDYLYTQHLPVLTAMSRALRGHGVKILSPGWIQRNFTEDSPFEPGIITWGRIAEPTYNNEVDGNGVHIYGYGFPGISPNPQKPEEFGGDIDKYRFMFQVRFWSMMRHLPIWIDEVNIDRGPKVHIPATIRMAAVLGMARTIRDAKYLPQRVEFFCPFAANGTGQGYNPEFIMKDPACYTMIKNFMAE